MTSELAACRDIHRFKTYHVFTALQAWLGLPTTNDLWKS